MDQVGRVRLLVRQLGIDGLAGVVIRQGGKTLILCEQLMDDDDETRRADICNELLECLDDGPPEIPAARQSHLRAVG